MLMDTRDGNNDDGMLPGSRQEMAENGAGGSCGIEQRQECGGLGVYM